MAFDWNSGMEAGSNYATGQEPWNTGVSPSPDASRQAEIDAHPPYMSGGRQVVWNPDMNRYVYADYGMTSGTPGGGSGVTGGSSGGGGGSGGSIGNTFSGAIGFYPGKQSGGGGSNMDENAIMQQVRDLFAQLSGTAQARAATDFAAYRGSREQQMASSYLTDMFSQGISTRMADELAGRLRTAQSARGLAYGGAPAMAEASLLTSMAEKQRAELLPTLLQKAQYDATLRSELEKSYAAAGTTSAQGAAGMGAVFADLFRTAQNQGGAGNAQYNALAALFGGGSITPHLL